MSLYYISKEDHELLVQAHSPEQAVALWLEYFELRDDLTLGDLTATIPEGDFIQIWGVYAPSEHQVGALEWCHLINHASPENRMQLRGYMSCKE